MDPSAMTTGPAAMSSAGISVSPSTRHILAAASFPTSDTQMSVASATQAVPSLLPITYTTTTTTITPHSNTPTDTPVINSMHHAPIAAIAGGAAGGVVSIAILVFLLFGRRWYAKRTNLRASLPRQEISTMEAAAGVRPYLLPPRAEDLRSMSGFLSQSSMPMSSSGEAASNHIRQSKRVPHGGGAPDPGSPAAVAEIPSQLQLAVQMAVLQQQVQQLLELQLSANANDNDNENENASTIVAGTTSAGTTEEPPMYEASLRVG